MENLKLKQFSEEEHKKLLEKYSKEYGELIKIHQTEGEEYTILQNTKREYLVIHPSGKSRWWKLDKKEPFKILGKYLLLKNELGEQQLIYPAGYSYWVNLDEEAPFALFGDYLILNLECNRYKICTQTELFFSQSFSKPMRKHMRKLITSGKEFISPYKESFKYRFSIEFNSPESINSIKKFEGNNFDGPDVIILADSFDSLSSQLEVFLGDCAKDVSIGEISKEKTTFILGDPLKAEMKKDGFVLFRGIPKLKFDLEMGHILFPFKPRLRIEPLKDYLTRTS